MICSKVLCHLSAFRTASVVICTRSHVTARSGCFVALLQQRGGDRESKRGEGSVQKERALGGKTDQLRKWKRHSATTLDGPALRACASFQVRTPEFAHSPQRNRQSAKSSGARMLTQSKATPWSGSAPTGPVCAELGLDATPAPLVHQSTRALSVEPPARHHVQQRYTRTTRTHTCTCVRMYVKVRVENICYIHRVMFLII